MIEILVVVVILAVLAALLYPVGKRALDNSRLTTCLNNLRQLSLASISYAQEHDGYLPSALGVFWQRELAPYIGIQSTPSGVELYGSDPAQKTPFTCPFVGKNNNPRRSYGINYVLQQGEAVDGYVTDPILGIQMPSKTFLFADALNTSFISVVGNMSFRHPNDACGFAFADGHVENLTSADLQRLKTAVFFRGLAY